LKTFINLFLPLDTEVGVSVVANNSYIYAYEKPKEFYVHGQWVNESFILKTPNFTKDDEV
jgi:hypothetical protein